MKRVLVVDDDPDLGWLIADLLERGGYEAVIASNGEEALERRPETFDALVLDCRMPRLSGEALKRLLDARAIHVPTIFTSADQDLSRVAQQLGGHGFLLKPFDPDHLLALVARAVGEQPAPQARTQAAAIGAG